MPQPGSLSPDKSDPPVTTLPVAEQSDARVNRLDYAFMPAALEVLHRPPTPLSRITLLLIVILAAIAIAWATMGKMDIVVTAMGKVVPVGRVKVIQPLETGIVRKIHVRDGQVVRAGDILIELDSTDSTADRRAIEKELLTAKMEVSRFSAQIEKQASIPAPPAEMNRRMIAKYNRILKSAVNEHDQRLSMLESEIERCRAEIVTAASNVSRLKDSLQLSEGLFAKKNRLATLGIITRAEFIQAEIEMVNARKSLQVERNRRLEAKARMTKATEQKHLAAAEYRHQLLDQLSEAEKKRDNFSEQLVKIQNRQINSTLKAPVDGIVQQLAINTVGGVVTVAQPLMVIVPLDSGLEIEANVFNKDIGFVEAGQTVSVKVDAYPFTRHGDLPGTLEWVGQDAVLNQHMGPVYPIRVSVAGYQLPNEINGRRGYIAPGMTVTTDITIGRRRVIEYFIGPILRYKDESLRER